MATHICYQVPGIPGIRYYCSIPTRGEGTWFKLENSRRITKQKMNTKVCRAVDLPDLHLVGTRQDRLRGPLSELGGVVLQLRRQDGSPLSNQTQIETIETKPKWEECELADYTSIYRSRIQFELANMKHPIWVKAL